MGIFRKSETETPAETPPPSYDQQSPTPAVESAQPVHPTPVASQPSHVAQQPQHISQQQQQQQPPQQVYYQQHSYVVPLERLAEQPEEVDCPFCHQRGLTRVDKEDSNTTVGLGVLLCCVCVCLACLPCMLGWAQNINHFCSKCGKQLTSRKHDQQTVVTPAAMAARQQPFNAGYQSEGKSAAMTGEHYQPPVNEQHAAPTAHTNEIQPVTQPVAQPAAPSTTIPEKTG